MENYYRKTKSKLNVTPSSYKPIDFNDHTKIHTAPINKNIEEGLNNVKQDSIINKNNDLDIRKLDDKSKAIKINTDNFIKTSYFGFNKPSENIQFNFKQKNNLFGNPTD
jgi:hypothetical protein